MTNEEFSNLKIGDGITLIRCGESINGIYAFCCFPAIASPSFPAIDSPTKTDRIYPLIHTLWHGYGLTSYRKIHNYIEYQYASVISPREICNLFRIIKNKQPRIIHPAFGLIRNTTDDE